MSAMLAFPACTGTQPKGRAIEPAGGEFSIDVDGIKPGEVRFYHYKTGKKYVVFLVARTASGELRTAFDACVTCYPYREGYRTGGGCVVCIKCNTSFGLDELGEGKGNCIPIKIGHTLKDGKLVLDRSEVEAGARWF